MVLSPSRTAAFCFLLTVGALLPAPSAGREQTARPAQKSPPPKFGGAYSGLEPRRQKLVNDWVARFSEVIGQKLEPAAFYDEKTTLSQKTTFDAITYALMNTPLTDESGSKYGDGLSLVQRVDSVRGQVSGAPGDRQFRMYVRLAPGAVDMMERSREFRRGMDNTVYHHGYPENYRGQGGTPSIQVSVAGDGLRADIDVDYRSSSFPAAMFNGHLTASNSDIRAGNNYDRYASRWAGLQNWWRSFFGIRTTDTDEDPGAQRRGLNDKPRAGNQTIDVMMSDFLKAWLIDGDQVAAMAYVSERAYACLAQDLEDPSTFDRGMAPYRLLNRLKASHDAVGTHSSLEGLTVGVRLGLSALKVVRQPNHARFVLYSVPDDIASRFDCESQLMIGKPKAGARTYGRYFGAAFYVNTPEAGEDRSVVLLWAKDAGYWKIVSWEAEPVRGPGEDDLDAPPTTQTAATIKADPTLVSAVKDFLESWLIRKNYDAAFKYVAPSAYPCYDLVKSADAPASTSPEDAGQKIRAALQRSGDQIPKESSLSAVIDAVPPFHHAVRLLSHPYASAFALTSLPNAIVSAADCVTRARGERFTGEFKGEYGKAFGTNLRFRTGSGDAPVLRLLWTKGADAWRIISYDIEQP